jgi:hypothetical protein
VRNSLITIKGGGVGDGDGGGVGLGLGAGDGEGLAVGSGEGEGVGEEVVTNSTAGVDWTPLAEAIICAVPAAAALTIPI